MAEILDIDADESKTSEKASQEVKPKSQVSQAVPIQEPKAIPAPAPRHCDLVAARDVTINGQRFEAGEKVAEMVCHPDITLGDLISAITGKHVVRA